jgi:hypothetical protein
LNIRFAEEGTFGILWVFIELKHQMLRWLKFLFQFGKNWRIPYVAQKLLKALFDAYSGGFFVKHHHTHVLNIESQSWS